IGGAFHDVDFRIRNSIARLTESGLLDTGFDPADGCDAPVYTIKLQPSDGKPMIGGIFQSIDHVRRMGYARLLTNGLLDTSFMDTGMNQFAGLIKLYSFDAPHSVNSLAIQTNGDMIIGGSFTNLGGNSNFEVEAGNP